MNKIKMAKIVLMCLILTLSLSGCNSDNAPDVIDITDKVGEIHYLNSLSDNFNDFVNNQFFKLGWHGLSHKKPEVSTRADLPPDLAEEYAFLSYTPLSLWFEGDEVYCAAVMDKETFQLWEAYLMGHKEVGLYVHSKYLYDSNTGAFSTTGKVLPGEDGVREFFLGKDKENRLILGEILEKPVEGSYVDYSSNGNGTNLYEFLYAYYQRISRYYPFDTELKVFDTNEEAVAYAKELMAQ